MKEKIIQILRSSILDLKGIYIFGSRAFNEALPSSDWDIAFLNKDEILDPVKKWEVQLNLENELNSDVDLVDLKNASTVFRFEIISNSQRIWTGDAEYCAVFEMLTFSMYQRLQWERREILEEVRKRKSVYG